MPARTKNLTPTLINKAYAELPKEWAILIDEMYVALNRNLREIFSVHCDMVHGVEWSSSWMESIECAYKGTAEVLDKFDRKDWK